MKKRSEFVRSDPEQRVAAWPFCAGATVSAKKPDTNSWITTPGKVQARVLELRDWHLGWGRTRTPAQAALF